MASIANDPKGLRRILFTDPQGERKAIRLGKVSQRTAEGIKYRVEQLLEAINFKRSMEADLVQWVTELEPRMVKKLAAVGLIPKPEAKAAATLGQFVESYISRRNDVSPHTRRIWRQTARKLSAHFGEHKPLEEITRGDAAGWRLSLVAAKMADASVRKHCGFAKHFFAAAVDHELIPANPFAKLVSAPVGNPARQFFVSRDDTTKILAAAPDAQWRLLIALSRFGGMRCPSEHLSLTWADVDWEHNRINVRSPKTARHAGHESRIVPLFPELRPFLEEAFHEAPEGVQHVIWRYRDANLNLRTGLKRIIVRAGLKVWPRITHNLRASLATELAAEHPSHVAAAWLGHSTLVAQKHYWTVTDADYERAAEGGAISGAPEAQNRAQRKHAESRHESHDPSATDDQYVTCAKLRDSRRHSDKKMAEVHGNRTHLPHG